VSKYTFIYILAYLKFINVVFGFKKLKIYFLLPLNTYIQVNVGGFISENQ